MSIAFFDTETHKDWVCQIAVLITTDSGEPINKFSTIIHSDGRLPCLKYCYPVHGISIDKSDTYGIHHSIALDLVMDYFDMADTLVAHNFPLDDRFLRYTADSCGPDTLSRLVDIFNNTECLCTMKSTKEYFNLKNKNGGIKPPKLDEIYEILFGHPPYRSGEYHDAMKDVSNLARCYFELKKLGVL